MADDSKDMRDIPPFAALRAFEATFRLGGVRKAAQGLGVSHTIVSRHIASLEDYLGVALVSRSSSGLTLNEAGRHYHRKVTAALAELAFATRQLYEKERDRTLRLCCIPGLSIQWLAGELIDFERLHPEFMIDLKPTDTPADLHAHEADVNILFRRDSEEPLIADKWIKVEEIVRPKQMAIVSPELAGRLANIGGAEDLLQWPLLHGGHQDDWRAWLSFNGVSVPGQLPGILCWHVHMAIAAAKMGRGILLTNRFLVHHELARGELVELRVANTSRVALGAYLFAAREDRWTSPAIAMLRRFLRDHMRDHESA